MVVSELIAKLQTMPQDAQVNLFVPAIAMKESWYEVTGCFVDESADPRAVELEANF